MKFFRQKGLFANGGQGGCVHVPRTLEGTVFEVVSVLLLIVMWAVIIRFMRDLPETIPVHFGFTGEPDGYGSKSSLWALGIVGTVAVVVMLVCAYFPRSVNLPVRRENPRQMALSVRLVRILSVMIALLFIAIMLNSGREALGLPVFVRYLPMVVVAVLLLTTIVYCVKIYQSRT